MHLCLSSSSREGYSRDVVDTLAAPIGSEIQFRYDSKWISPDILGKPANECDAILSFIELRGKPGKPFIMPLRVAKIFAVERMGTTAVVMFRLGGYPVPSDIKEFSDKLHATHRDIHKYQDATKPSGYLWLELGDEIACPPINPGGPEFAWESIVNNFVNAIKYPDNYSHEIHDKSALNMSPYADASPFYMFHSVIDRNSGQPAAKKIDGDRSVFSVRPGEEYTVNIYHKHPSKDFPGVKLRITPEDSGSSIIGAKEHPFNTRYDMKKFNVAVPRTISGSTSSLLVSRIFEEKSGKQLQIDDYRIYLEARPSFALLALYCALIGALFLLAQIPILFKATGTVEWWAVCLIGVAGILLGFVTWAKDNIIGITNYIKYRFPNL
ncbi:hypothetical protein [Magnetospirillum aberrantis]|uniref:Uncharacterized protein n=1 Tax=Magnetospirillum aberrantis SpK TaxID=908842 RepID=A0A7C9UWF7_9PROT|nr:hypothetical protein [Magnetospirillum aberrantis]NFV80689.1 hypothetical protein [Magnetospirillum aberrantis SpK]